MSDATLCNRIRGLRKQKRWTQEELADAAGVSVTTIKKAENPGSGSVTTGTLHAIATALEVTTTELYTDRAPDPMLSAEPDHQALARLRAAISPPVGLTGTPLTGASDAPVDLARIHTRLAALTALYDSDQYDTVAEELPTLVVAAHQAVAELDTDDAYRARALVLRMAGKYCTQIRKIDLALAALRLCIQDAVQAGDQAIASTAISGQGWALTRQGRLDECERLCVTVADEIEPRSLRKATAAEVAAWGDLLFRAAAAAVRDGSHDRAWELMHTASAAASALGKETACWSTFGPMTVALKSAEFSLLEGRPDRTLRAAERLPDARDVGDVTAVNRYRHRLDVAQSLVMTGDPDQAARVMSGVKDSAPAWLRRQRSAYETTRSILESRPRRPTEEMVSLASHLGVTA
jgi:transcriptional regulator with XRE-family HTH domain